MAMNKYMHPRNIYRSPPDFSKLAKSYLEFAKISKLDVNGKVNIDFKNPQSLRVLTKCLLHADFNLKVEIPEDRLVPTLPLRLNYILWLEDLMAAIEVQRVTGIDIGTGACAVYPLLGAKKNKWNMIGTETDAFSAETAQRNVLVNNLDELIKILKTSSPTLLQHLFVDNDNSSFDFCMCNPPFYSNVQELLESRSPARPPPKNGFTGSPQELITEGGELEFIRKLIAESKFIKENVQIYTTMVGHKFNLNVLLEDLKSDNITHTYTEFCQGRITRWGLAWTFKDYNIHDLVPAKGKLKKPSAPLTCLLPALPNEPYDLENVNKKIYRLFKELSISYKVVSKRIYSTTLDISAATNTWSNQRKRKRMLKRLEDDFKKRKGTENDEFITMTEKTANIDCDTGTCIHSTIVNKLDGKEPEDNRNDNPGMNKCIDTTIKNNLDVEVQKESRNVDSGTSSYIDTITENKLDGKEPKESRKDAGKSTCIDTTLENIFDIKKEESKNNEKMNSKHIDPIVHALSKIVKRGDNFMLETNFLNGTGGKESIHQIIQYIKNNWK